PSTWARIQVGGTNSTGRKPLRHRPLQGRCTALSVPKCAKNGPPLVQPRVVAFGRSNKAPLWDTWLHRVVSTVDPTTFLPQRQSNQDDKKTQPLRTCFRQALGLHSDLSNHNSGHFGARAGRNDQKSRIAACANEPSFLLLDRLSIEAA